MAEVMKEEVGTLGEVLKKALDDLARRQAAKVRGDTDWIVESASWIYDHWREGQGVIAITNGIWYNHVLHGITYRFLKKYDLEYKKLGGYAWMRTEDFDALAELKGSVGLPLQISDRKPMFGIPHVTEYTVVSIERDHRLY